MRQNHSLWMLATLLLVGSITMLTSCKHDADDYVKKPYSVTDDDRIRYAEGKLGITIDRQQDWTMSQQYSIKVTANAALENIAQVTILDGNPYVDVTNLLAVQSATNDQTVTMSFRAPAVADLLYVACITKDGQCIARPFTPGEDTSLSFADVSEQAKAPALHRAADAFGTDFVINPPVYIEETIKDFYSFRNAVRKILPEGHNNSSLIGASEYLNTVQVRRNPYGTYSLSLHLISGDGSDEDNIWYNWYPEGQTDNMQRYLIVDNYQDKDIPKQEVKNSYALTGHYLYARDGNKNIMEFMGGDILDFHLARSMNPVDDADKQRVKVFMLNGYVFVACEDGDDWDYNDRLYWMPYGQDRVEKATVVPVKPEPTRPQVWTYAWEDNTMEGDDRCDYDMNDCVIEVNEKADDPTMLEITIVALGATRDLWLGFENKNGKTISDYQPVFAEGDYSQDANELHKLMKANPGEMVNTGNNTRTVEPFKATVRKPAGFDFQTCSFVLGAKVRKEMQGAYEHDFYMLHVSTAGTDSHGIVIPGKWQWPTERTRINVAYPQFNTWASDHTKAKDWYKNPNSDSVVKGQ